MAENTLWPGGPTQYPWPDNPFDIQIPSPSSSSATPAAPVDRSAIDAVLTSLRAKHGAVLGTPTKVIKKGTGGAKDTDTGYDHYTFADGSSVDIANENAVNDSIGATQNYKPAPGSEKNKTWGTPLKVDQGNGTSIYYGVDPADGQQKPIPGPNGQPITSTA